MTSLTDASVSVTTIIFGSDYLLALTTVVNTLGSGRSTTTVPATFTGVWTTVHTTTLTFPTEEVLLLTTFPYSTVVSVPLVLNAGSLRPPSTLTTSSLVPSNPPQSESSAPPTSATPSVGVHAIPWPPVWCNRRHCCRRSSSGSPPSPARVLLNTPPTPNRESSEHRR